MQRPPGLLRPLPAILGLLALVLTLAACACVISWWASGTLFELPPHAGRASTRANKPRIAGRGRKSPGGLCMGTSLNCEKSVKLFMTSHFIILPGWVRRAQLYLSPRQDATFCLAGTSPAIIFQFAWMGELQERGDAVKPGGVGFVWPGWVLG